MYRASGVVDSPCVFGFESRVSLSAPRVFARFPLVGYLQAGRSKCLRSNVRANRPVLHPQLVCKETGVSDSNLFIMVFLLMLDALALGTSGEANHCIGDLIIGHRAAAV